MCSFHRFDSGFNHANAGAYGLRRQKGTKSIHQHKMPNGLQQHRMQPNMRYDRWDVEVGFVRFFMCIFGGLGRIDFVESNTLKLGGLGV